MAVSFHLQGPGPWRLRPRWQAAEPASWCLQAESFSSVGIQKSNRKEELRKKWARETKSSSRGFRRSRVLQHYVQKKGTRKWKAVDSARNSGNGEEEWKRQGSFVISASVSSAPGALWISSKADLKQTSRNLNVKLDAASVSKFWAQEAFVCYYSFSISMVAFNVCVSFSISDFKKKKICENGFKGKMNSFLL